MKKILLYTTACAAILMGMLSCEKAQPKNWPNTITTTEVGTFINVQVDSTQAFWMGSNNGDANEQPMHKVTLTKSFYIGQLEVTQAQWEAIMGSNPVQGIDKGDSLPINNISQTEAVNFAKKLSELTGRPFRLPNEAEWEFAAMGGKLGAYTADTYTYSGSENAEEVAWFSQNSDDELHRGGLKQPNQLGIYDMSGNVAEWCNDKAANYTSSAKTNPVGKTGSGYAVRGGGCDSNADNIRVKARVAANQTVKTYNIGIRLLLEAPKDSELIY